MSPGSESAPPAPGGTDAREFGARLESLFRQNRDRIYSSMADGAFRPLQKSMSRTAVANRTGIHRGRVSEIFAGTTLPRDDELRVMLSALSAEPLEVQAWVRVLRRVSSGKQEPLEWQRYDPETDGLFMKAVWTVGKPATPERFVIHRVDPPRQRWIQPEKLAKAGADGSGAKIPYLVGIDVDHRESSDTELCRIRLATGSYADARALNRLRVSDPDALTDADAQLATNLDGYLASAAPASLNVNIVPLTSDDLTICVRRSAGVESAQGCWTVGVVETMKADDGHFHDLARRALVAELGVESTDVSDMWISWLGFYRPVLRGHLVAVARLNLTANATIHKTTSADERYEASAFDAMDPFDLWAELADAPTQTSSVDAHPLLLAPDRNWVDHSRLAAAETMRYLEGG